MKESSVKIRHVNEFGNHPMFRERDYLINLMTGIHNKIVILYSIAVLESDG